MAVLCHCLVVLLLALAVCSSEAIVERHAAKIYSVFEDMKSLDMRMENPRTGLVEEIAQHIRSRRQASNQPTIHGDHLFTGDGNPFATIYYVGNTSPVIIVLTSNSRSSAPTRTYVYRSTDYGATFQRISSRIGSPLWYNFHVSSSSNLVVFYHATQSKIYVSQDDGATFTTRSLSPTTINACSFVWNPQLYQSAIAHDPTNDVLYVTQNLGVSWIRISTYVSGVNNYQWGNNYDNDTSVVYYNTFNPSDAQRGDFTVNLYSQRSPYSPASRREVDPNLGRHDDFLLLGPYIFAARNDSGTVHLYISYNRQPFNLAKIPSTDPHRNYYVTHINELQALVIVQHVSGLFNLYLSDITGVYFSLSLENIVVGRRGLDLERIDGINGTMIANRNERVNATTTLVRTVVTLDNGGEWNYLTPPQFDLSGNVVLCEPPSCSLHFQMASSEYARLGVYSQESAPGIIIAHGNIGVQLSSDPDLYISRDGGVSWAQTLAGSWGVTVVDHGGLLVAADDYHKEPSTIIKYSCDEGASWRNYTYTSTPMTVYGVITEPGEETTTVSLFGVKQNTIIWDVVTVNFSSIYSRVCNSNDYYLWQPWDARTESDCILGQDVTLERRLPTRCCLIGLNYDRPISVTICQCSVDDYECDYGYKPADGLNGPCVLDPAIPLQDPCADGKVKTVIKSRGYRKIAGDVCNIGDFGAVYEPYNFTCCSSGAVTPNNNVVTTAHKTMTTTVHNDRTTTDSAPSTTGSNVPSTTKADMTTTASAPSTTGSNVPSTTEASADMTTTASADMTTTASADMTTTASAPSTTGSNFPSTTKGNGSVSPSPGGQQSNNGNTGTMIVGLAIALAASLVLSFIMVIVAAVFIWKYSHMKRGKASSARVQFRAAGGDSSGEDTERLLHTYTDDDDEDDDPPLAL